MKENPDRELTYFDLEKLTLMNAYIKVCLNVLPGDDRVLSFCL